MQINVDHIQNSMLVYPRREALNQIELHKHYENINIIRNQSKQPIIPL
jgi:hypothetical protein